MAVEVSTSGTFTSGRPRRLFGTPKSGAIFIHPYDVFPDGKRFLMIDRDTTPPRHRSHRRELGPTVPGSVAVEPSE